MNFFQNFLKKIQEWPDSHKKIVLWAIVGVLAIIMAIFWFRASLSRIANLDYGSLIPQLELPKTAEPAADQAPAWQTYANDEYGFEIDYPGDWVYQIMPQSSGIGTVIRFIDSGGTYTVSIYNPVQEIGYESHELIKTEQIKIENSDKYFTKKTFEPIKSASLNSLIIASWNNDDWKNSGEIILPYPPGNDANPNIEVFNQMLSTFKFIK